MTTLEQGATSMPQVSVIMPTFNASSTVVRAIDSALAQDGAAIEIVVVDDCSKDDTRAVIQATYGHDPRVRLFVLEVNGGPSKARNFGMAQATGEWIALLDADDLWLPDRLDRLLAVSADVDFVADNQLAYDAIADQTTGPLFREVVCADHLDLCGIMNYSPRYDLGQLKPLMRRSFMRDHGLSYRDDVRHGEDFILYSEAICLGARFRISGYAGYVYTTPVGVISKKVSPHSQSTYDSAKFTADIARMKTRFADRLSDREQRAIDNRIYRLNEFSAYVAFVTALKRLDPLRAISVLARRPALVRSLFEAYTLPKAPGDTGRVREIRPV